MTGTVPQGWTSEMGSVEREGTERVPSLPTSRTWAEGSRTLDGSTWAQLALTLRVSHSNVSHCFLSCSTEPGAGTGAGLTSCLVFRNKSSKGSLAFGGTEGCSAGSRP